MTLTNHWSLQERAAGRRDWGGDYDRIGAQSAEGKPSEDCGLCGRATWFKATVGRYVCTCGAVLHDGAWTMPTYPHR